MRERKKNGGERMRFEKKNYLRERENEGREREKMRERKKYK